MILDDNYKDSKKMYDGKTMIIGILGAPINNGNMGCLALTYSLLSMLEEIAKSLNMVFIYYDFEGVKDSKRMYDLCHNLGIKKERIKSFNIYPVESFMGLCHRPHKVFETMSALKKCDLFIDLTQGDSFSDIYGNSVFSKNVNGKILVEDWLKKPLILGPQTYGPYQNEKNMKRAKIAIEKATLVIARDYASAQYVNSFTEKKVHTTTDLAFILPYKRSSLNFFDKERNTSKDKKCNITVGVNISGLLSKNKQETTPTEFKLMTEYDVYIDKLMMWLISKGYDVSVVPHVFADYECGKSIVKKYPKAKIVDMCKNPVDIKSKISEFDIFIGARMHATIGAFSSGVATIPTAYSRKFNGLYESVGYPYIVDLLNLSTKESLELTKKYVENHEDLKVAARKSMEKINLLEKKTSSLLKEQIVKTQEEI